MLAIKEKAKCDNLEDCLKGKDGGGQAVDSKEIVLECAIRVMYRWIKGKLYCWSQYGSHNEPIKDSILCNKVE